MAESDFLSQLISDEDSATDGSDSEEHSGMCDETDDAAMRSLRSSTEGISSKFSKLEYGCTKFSNCVLLKLVQPYWYVVPVLDPVLLY